MVLALNQKLLIIIVLVLVQIDEISGLENGSEKNLGF